jgi:hypothetical protein
MIVATTGAAVLYVKAGPAALSVVRFGMPISTVAATILTGAPRGLIWLAIGAVLTALAWHRDIRLAIHPLAGEGRAVPMLPEMVPAEIRQAARIDERGRPIDPGDTVP